MAALSLCLPSQPSYDPWAWLVWGKEIGSLELDTRGGPSWKPLPVAFTLAVSPLAELDDAMPPALWLLVARAGALLALVLAYRVAARLAGPDRGVGRAAGLIAATALLLSPLWIRYMAHGNEAPVAVALMLWAVERHLERAPQQALLLGFLACLLRPETFPFWAIYATVLWTSRPAHRGLVATLALALPVLWLVPEWIGSGNPLGAGAQARSEPSWSLSLHDQPWLAALRRGHRLAGLPLELGALAGLAFALRRRERAALALAGVALAWFGLVLAMTEIGFSGNERYFLPSLVVASLLAGTGAARVVRAAGTLAERLALRAAAARTPPHDKPAGGAPIRPVAVVAAAILLAFGALPNLEQRLDGLRGQAETAAELAELHRELARAVQRLGGPDVVIAHGAPAVNRVFATHLAWELELPIRGVESGRGQAIVFITKGRPAGPPPELPAHRRLQVIARVGAWRVLRPQSAGAWPRRSHSAAGGEVRGRQPAWHALHQVRVGTRLPRAGRTALRRVARRGLHVRPSRRRSARG